MNLKKITTIEQYKCLLKNWKKIIKENELQDIKFIEETYIMNVSDSDDPYLIDKNIKNKNIKTENMKLKLVYGYDNNKITNNKTKQNIPNYIKNLSLVFHYTSSDNNILSGSIENIKIPNSVIFLDLNIYYDNIENIKYLIIPKSVIYLNLIISSENSLHNKNIKNLNIPETVLFLTLKVDSNCKEIENLVLPNSIKYLEYFVNIRYCDSHQSNSFEIYLPKIPQSVINLKLCNINFSNKNLSEIVINAKNLKILTLITNNGHNEYRLSSKLNDEYDDKVLSNVFNNLIEMNNSLDNHFNKMIHKNTILNNINKNIENKNLELTMTKNEKDKFDKIILEKYDLSLLSIENNSKTKISIKLSMKDIIILILIIIIFISYYNHDLKIYYEDFLIRYSFLQNIKNELDIIFKNIF
jgi:hypothetical protein